MTATGFSRAGIGGDDIPRLRILRFSETIIFRSRRDDPALTQSATLFAALRAALYEIVRQVHIS